jgi:hypothetical protein
MKLIPLDGSTPNDDHQYTQLALEVLHTHFEATGNPFLVFQAYQVAVAQRLYPPAWVIEWMGHAIKGKFHRQESFDLAFGFKGRGKGRFVSPEEQWRMYLRNGSMCTDAGRLICLGVPLEHAYRAIANRLLRRTGEDLGDRQVRSIVKAGLTSKWLDQIRLSVASMDEGAKKQVLREFGVSVSTMSRKR